MPLPSQILLEDLLFDRLLAGGLVPDASSSQDEQAAFWVEQGVTLPHHQAWLRCSIELLRAGIGSPGAMSAAARRDDWWTQWQRLEARWSKDGDLASMARALSAVLSNLPAILRGDTPVQPLLPVDATLDWLVDERDPGAIARCSAAVYDFVDDYLVERVGKGAGAGGLRIADFGPPDRKLAAPVERLLRRHAPHLAEYAYNGLGNPALDRLPDKVRRPLSKRSFDLVDLGRSDEAGEDRFDLVIVSRLLHQVCDVRHALNRIKRSLKENGILILDEIGGFDWPAHMTVGLLPGWWGPEDPQLRIGGSPAIASAPLLDTLEEAGFRGGFVLAAELFGLKRQILLAESDGVMPLVGEKTDRTASAPPVAAVSGQGGPQAQSADSEATLGNVTAIVRESLASVLRLDAEDIRDDANFDSFGVDSLTSGRIINLIAERLSVSLPATLMFDFSTVTRLSAHLSELQPPTAPALQAAVPAVGSPGLAAGAPVKGGDEGAGAACQTSVRRLLIERPGTIADLRIISEPVVPLGPRDVRIAVRAFSLNFGDLLCVKGLYPTMPPYPFTPGMEVSGVVVACGEAVTAVAPGESVVAMTGPSFGGHATIVVVEEHQIWLKPESLSFSEACSLPIAAITAIEVFRRAAVEPGQRILIQTAAGGVGLVAVQLALHLGAQVIATAGTQEKLDYLVACGVTHAINYRTMDFAAEIGRITAGRGVDVVVNTLSGDALQKGIECLAPGGRYIEIAMTGLKAARSVDLSVLNNNQSFHSLDLRRQLKEAPERMAELYVELTSWVERGVIRPVVGSVVPFELVGHAYALIEQRQNIGKVVVEVPSAVEVAELPPRKRMRGSPSSAARLPAPAAPGTPEPLAIVGMSGRYPRSDNLDILWRHLAEGVDLTEPVSRWKLPNSIDGTAGWRGSFLDGIDQFDPAFFNITDLEARYMDPQQRVFLEEAWNALEDAGYVGEAVERKRCGVFVGAAAVDYQARFPNNAPPQSFWGNVGSVIPARIAYHLDLQGPAVAVDTACSSSLVAIHLACQSLWLGEVDMALAGGVFLQPGPSFYLSSISAEMISPTGRCHAFDNRANGFVPGEGAGALVLKRFSDAVADRDHIHGLIEGIGTNQDGTTSGITAPSGRAQRQLLQDVYTRFGIEPKSIQLVEAHGTGTKLGDPIELAALTEAFGNLAKSNCAINSIKANLGHTVTAAGVTGVIKILLALRNRQIPPSLNFASANSNIDFAASPFYVSTQLHDWIAPASGPRRAAVSSFGFSGTNAHAIIQEAPEMLRRHSIKPAYLIVLSARDPGGLRGQAERLCDWCAIERSAEIGDVSFTLMSGRRHFDYRLAVVGKDFGELRGSLLAWLAGDAPAELVAGRAPARAEERASATQRLRNLQAEWPEELTDDEFRRELARIGGQFVSGGSIDCEAMFGGEKRGRIPLPTYPFSRRSFWLEDSPAVDAAGVGSGELEFIAREWQPAEPVADSTDMPAQRHWVLLAPSLSALQPRLAALLPDADIDLLLDDVGGELGSGGGAKALVRAVTKILERVGPSLRSNPSGRLKMQVVGIVPVGGLDWVGALSGLFKSAGLENPRFAGQVITADEQGNSDSADVWARRLIENSRSMMQGEVRYAGAGTRSVAVSKTVAPDKNAPSSCWKEGGVYVLTGGAGALGQLFAREIATRCGYAVIVLAGRSKESDDLRVALGELRAAGCHAEYRKTDITDRAEVDALVAAILRDHGRIDGIIHAAGVVNDDFFIRKSGSKIRNVMYPKVIGIENIDKATCDLPMDIFAIFSSIAGLCGNAGQADYAAANAFLDGFAEYRSERVERGERQGRTISIGWPLWADGGMARSEAQRALLAEAGMPPMATALGLNAFYAALASGQSRLGVMLAPPLAAAEKAAVPHCPAPRGSRSQQGSGIGGELWDSLIAILRDVTELTVDRFEGDAPFESLGMDSLMIARLHRRLSPFFPDLPKTVFFEHLTLKSLHDHLLTDYPDECAAWPLNVAPSISAAAASVKQPGTISRAGYMAVPSDAAKSAAEGIAIIGMSGVYPDAPDLDRFWENLAAGRDCLTTIPPERWAIDEEHHDDPDVARQTGKSYCKVGGFIAGFANFDPLFFGISPAEALSMDPQERLFLQECWRAMEDAGYTRDILATRHKRSVGVFAGMSKTGYELHNREMWRHGEQVHLRTSFSSAANRASYFLGLHGPSIALDTMCSSSLVAIHQACESLFRGECELAFAGGANLYLHPETYATLCAAGMLSSNGKCRSFGAAADGFVPGEGVGVLLLKPLERAIADGDNIHAVIRATAINHGGHTHGYTVPNPRAQRELVESVLAKAGVNARDIGYVEAHGTGTALGDPVEVAALSQAFAAGTSDRQFCAIGSVKSNIGHCEAAAGIAGVMKAVLQLKQRMLVPSLHAAETNRDIRFEQTPFQVQQALADWPARQLDHIGVGSVQSRLAGVSSFGAGGTNGHIILQEHPETRERGEFTAGEVVYVIVSAREAGQLRAAAEGLAAWIEDHSPRDQDLPDIAYTLQVGREAMRHRLAVAVSSVDALLGALRRFVQTGTGDREILLADSATHKEDLAAILTQADPIALTETLIEQADLRALFELWTKGMTIDWSRFHGSRQRRRISLPGYPFAQERYWPKGASSARANDGKGVRLLFPSWKYQSRSSDPLLRTGDGTAVMVVTDGAAPPNPQSFAHVITPTADTGIEALADMLARCGSFEHVFWRAPDNGTPAVDDDALLQELHRCVQPCFRLIKALLRLGYGQRPLCLTVVTRRAVAVFPTERPDPAQAALHGLLGSLAKEHPGWRVRVVDVDRSEEPPLTELLSIPADPGGDAIAVRGGRWFRQYLTEGSDITPDKQPFRRGGCYVVLGGAGHIGTVLTEHLVRDCQARVAWIGRRPLDDAIQAAIDGLASHGPAPIYIQADAADRSSLEAARRRIVAELGAINGVVHSTIVLSDASIANMSEDLFLAALRAKADTSVRMAQTFGRDDLDFVLYFSSLESFGKLPGQSNYAAGCLFADAFAHALRAAWQVPVKILNWGNWTVIDGAAASPAMLARMSRTGIGALTPLQGLEGIAILMAGPFDQFGFYTPSQSGDVQLLARAAMPMAVADLENVASPNRSADRIESDPATKDVSRAVRDTLIAQLRQALGLTSHVVAIDEPLSAYGIDSITGLQFIRLVNLVLKIDLDVKDIYDHPTIGALTKLIISRFGVDIADPGRSIENFGKSGAGRTVQPADIEPEDTRPADTRPADTRPEDTRKEPRDDLIAVVGLAARYPQSPDANALWKHLAAGHDLVGEAARWRGADGDYGSLSPPMPGGFIDDVECFDASFFGISKIEARYTDPQQRIFLEEAWHALEDAGYAGSGIRGERCGVYVGQNGSDYHRLFTQDLPPQALWGNAASILSARIAYHLDLQGPAITIDTACSSSLVAIHLACQALRNGEVDIGLAGGVQVYATPSFHLAAGKAGMLSPTGRCHSFDDRADGFVPAEGVGVVVLKRLADAIAAQDTIYGVVRGGATNQDGTTNGITAPSGLSQERLEREVYRSAGIRPCDIQMVEAHGTGTRLGDPIEFGALAAVFKEDGAVGTCALGSIKTNIGHALAASGVAGAIKVLLALREEQIPPSLHFEQTNSRIRLEGSPFYVPGSSVAWPRNPQKPRLAAVSSFGFSGTNAHLVFEEAPPPRLRKVKPGPHLVVLSAKSMPQLRQSAERLRDHCAASSVDCADLSFTLGVGRHHFAHRLALVVDDLAQLATALSAWIEDGQLVQGSIGSLCEKDIQDREGRLEPISRQVRVCRDPSLRSERIRDELLRLAQLHIQGYSVPFEELFEGADVRRVPLPGYPFRRDRHWIDEIESAEPSPTQPPPAVAYRNEDGRKEDSRKEDGAKGRPIRIPLAIDALEQCVQGHFVDDVPALPGITCLELVQQLFQENPEFATTVDLRDVVWLRPIRLSSAVVPLEAKVWAVLDQGWRFEICLPDADGAVACRGGAVPRQLAAEVAVSLEDARRSSRPMTGVDPAWMTSDSIESIAVGDGYLLVRLSPRGSASDPNRPAALHPAVLETVLSAWNGSKGHASECSQPPALLLFALEMLSTPCGSLPIEWAIVRERRNDHSHSAVIDVHLFSVEGEFAASFEGLTLRRSATPAIEKSRVGGKPAEGERAMRALSLVPCWQSIAQPSEQAPIELRTTLVVARSQRAAAWVCAGLSHAPIGIVSAATTVEATVEMLTAKGIPQRVVCCLADENSGEAQQAEPVGASCELLRTAKALVLAGGARSSIEFVVVTERATAKGNPAADQAAALAVAGCLAKEQPGWQVKAADLDSLDNGELADVLRLPAHRDGNVVALHEGRWVLPGFIDHPFDLPEKRAFREKGVYLIIGGAGALGKVLSEYLIRHYRARIFWLGRRSADAQIQADLARLAEIGSPPEYLRADARDPAAFRRALATIARHHPFIDGIVHSAIVMSGSDIAHMAEDTFSEVFATKADICRNVAELCLPGSVGMVLFFSSIQSLQRTERQSNYAAGCAYKDAFAGPLANRLECTVKVVNWGYWGSVGKAAEISAFQNWLNQAGMGSIEPEEGMAFLERFLASPFDQAAYVKLLDGTQLRGINLVEEGKALTYNENISLSEAVSMTASPALTSAILTETARYPTAEFERLLGRLLNTQLRSLGLHDHGGIDSRQWRERAGIIDLYRPWVEESLRMLSSLGYLERDGALYRVATDVRDDGRDTWGDWERSIGAWSSFPQLSAHIALVDATLRRLPAILTGRITATEIMFPGSSLKLVEPIYKENDTADYFNEVLADSLVCYVAEKVRQDPGVKIRILEIGAGTGGTTATLIRRLRPYANHISDYRYTDVSKAFLLHAEEAYGPNAPYLSYAIFDVEQPPETQAVPCNHFDVVVAANVLHATKSIRRTLDHVHACLKPHGLLLLNEMSTNSLFSHLTFGLLKGWWLSEDPDLRLTGSPVVPAASWNQALTELGFGTVRFPAEEAAHLGQQIIVAQNGPAAFTPVSLDTPSRPEAAVGQPAVDDADLRIRVKRAVVRRVSQALEIDVADIDPDMSFADYGYDSILAIGTVDALNEELDLSLTSTSLFEHTSVNLLTDYIIRCSEQGRAKPPVVARLPEPLRTQECDSAKVPSIASVPAAAGFQARGGPEAREQVPDNFARSTEVEPVAIVGASGRFGSADTLGDLWRMLAVGDESIVPVSRWDMADCYGVAEGTDGYCWHGGFLNDIDCFDPTFFNISGIEATYMDPQQRLFLEEAWKALEDGGYAGPAIEGQRCGVYVGQNGEDYRGLCAGTVPPQAMWGNAGAILSARISYYLNLKGPAITIDTACSSSLVAVHLACQALRLREIDVAIAGGVAARCTPEFYKATAATKMVSTSGHCRPFDEQADGFVPGEGVGAIVLKRLSDARADGDHIYAVVRGSCLNQDGTTNGITAPSAASQEQLYRDLFDLTKIDPRQIQLVEAHGTGTKLGDPIEHGALTRAFRGYTEESGFCAIGSIKANVGHTTAAAGIASVIKVILALKHRAFPPAPNFKAPNPLLNMEDSPFYVNAHLRDWPEPHQGRRCAIVSSFGISGTNATVVLEEAPPVAVKTHRAPAYLIALSATSNDQLREMVKALAAQCRADPSSECADISYTLIAGRRHMAWRLALIVRDTAELIAMGEEYLAGKRVEDLYSSVPSGLGQQADTLLSRFGQRCIEECAAGVEEGEHVSRLRTVAELFVQRQPLDLAALFPNRKGRRVRLPTYPFARTRYWATDVPPSAANAAFDPVSSQPTAECGTAAYGSAPQRLVLQGPRDPAEGTPNPYQEAVAALRNFIIDELRLPPEKVEIDGDIRVYGMDSLISMRLLRRLEQDFGVSLSHGELLEFRSIDAIAMRVARHSTCSDTPVSKQVQPTDAAVHKASEVLARLDHGEIDMAAAEALLTEIALA